MAKKEYKNYPIELSDGIILGFKGIVIMLNISDNAIKESIDFHRFKSFRLIRRTYVKKLSLIIVSVGLLIILVFLFLPWTQNIQAKGYVTTLRPEQRPQAIQSVISGRLEKWYIREGDYVEAGDTIIFISEVKNEYFDPNLIERTSEQVAAKSKSIDAYAEKVKAIERQYKALGEGMKLKIEQTRNKIIQTRNKIGIDSIDLIAFKTNLEIAENQLSRTQELYNKQLKSLSELQEKQLKRQSAAAKMQGQENKLLNQRNELVNLQIDLLGIEREYSEKIAKSQSDKQTALSSQLESVASTAKLQNQLSNYNQRQQFYYITAPQSGYITKTLKKGLREVIKEGIDIATIMPARYDLAVETYVKPQDLPLLAIGNSVRMRFDGWPAIVISGWPESSTGIFSGEIVAIDQFISENGHYRLLIKPDNSTRVWPELLRVGTGVDTYILLKDVPIWYELWRQLNGFPPDFYQSKSSSQSTIKRKAPIKSIK